MNARVMYTSSAGGKSGELGRVLRDAVGFDVKLPVDVDGPLRKVEFGDYVTLDGVSSLSGLAGVFAGGRGPRCDLAFVYLEHLNKSEALGIQTLRVSSQVASLYVIGGRSVPKSLSDLGRCYLRVGEEYPDKLREVVQEVLVPVVERRLQGRDEGSSLPVTNLPGHRSPHKGRKATGRKDLMRGLSRNRNRRGSVQFS